MTKHDHPALKNATPFIILLFITVVTMVTSNIVTPNMRNMQFILNVLNQSMLLIVSGMGILFVMSMGCIDLTHGAVIVLAPLVGFLLNQKIGGTFVLFTVLVGLVVGFATGCIYSLLRVPTFVATLCISFILRNLSYQIWNFTDGGYVYVPPHLLVLDNLGIKSLIVAVLALLMFYLFRFTRLGKNITYIGSDERVAGLSGVNVRWLKIVAFSISGTMAGLGALVSSLRTGSVALVSGQFFEWDVLIAVLLGGIPLTGGTNTKFLGVIIGAITMSVLNNGLVVCRVPTFYQEMLKGILLILIVSISFNREKILVIK